MSAASICLARVEAEKQVRAEEKVPSSFNGYQVNFQLSPDLSKSETRETSIFSSLTSLSDSIWSWLGYKTSSSPSRRRGYADFFDRLLPPEREQMYRAIGHDLTLTSVKNNADYVKWSVRLSLRRLDVALERQRHLAASAHLRGIDVVIKNIPVHERIDVAAEVNDVEVRGSSAKLSGTDEPVLLSMIKSDNSDKLFRFDLRTNPRSSDADASIVVQLSPVEIVLDVPTLSELGKLFTVDEANYADGFLRYAESKLDEFRTQAAVNLLYALEKAKIVVVDIDLKSPCFILPENGRATATTTGIRALVLDLGRLSVKQLRDRADLREVDSPFLRYDVNLANGRILVVGARDDWRRALDDSANDSSLDLLPPMSFLVRLFQSVEATTNPLVARLKVEANVDELCVRANDEKLIEALTLLTSVAKHFDAPPPSSSSCGEFKTSYHDTLKSDIAAVREAIHDDDTASFHTANDGFSDDDAAADGASSTFRGQSLVDVNLVMNRFALDVDRNAVAYVQAELTGLVVRVSVRRDNWDASVRLKGVEIVDAQRRAVVKDDDGPLRLVHAKTLVDDFIVVSVRGCDRRSTAYTGWEWEASVDVGEIDVTVHRQSLFDLRAFYDRLVWNENVLSRAVSRLEIDSSSEPEPELKSSAVAEKKIDSWRITARLKTVKIDVADDRLCVATITVRDVRGETSVSSGDGRAVEAKLRSVDVTNGGAATMYREVISMGRTRDHLFSVSLRRRGDGDETTLALSVGRVNVVYLHRFFADLYALARSFTDAWARLAKATAVASETARVRVVELERAGSPIRLEILVDSPAVLVPTSVSSTNAFFVSVGNLSLRNFDSESATSGVEHYQASFAGLSVYRRAGNWKHRRVLLSPIEVRLEATRRLDGATTTTTPPPRFQVWGEVDRVNFYLGKEDYVYICETMRDNLGEKSAVKREESPTPSSPLPVVTVVEEDFPDRGNGGLLLKCRFSVKRLQVVLYADEPPLTPDTCDRSASAKFASLVVDDVQVDGRENGGGRRRIEARVRAVTVRDCRPNRHGAIKDIIRHSETDQMFLIDYETRDEWDKTKLKMAKIRLCFCLKFFRKLRDFFETETTDGEGTFDASQFGRYLARNAGHAAAQLLTLDETDGTDSEATKRTIEFVCPAIEIVVPEKAKTTNCSALALSANFDGKIESHRGQKRIGVVAKSLNVVSYVFNNPRRTSIQLVRPFDADVEGLVTNSKQIIGVSVSKIEATLYHSALLTIDSLWKSFRRHGDDDDDDDVDLPPSSSNPFKAEPVDVTQWSVSTPVRMPPIRRAQIDQQLVVRTNAVSVIFQTPEQNVYRPALAVEIDVVLELRDWSHYPTAGADATLELKYYNARVETWEPLVEPVEFGEEGLYRPWAVSLCFIQYLNKPLLFGDVRVEDELIQNTLGFDSSARRSSRSSSSSFVSGGAGGLLVSPNLAPRRNSAVMETTESRSDDGELDETDGGDLHSNRTARLDSRHDDDDGDASSSLTVCNCVVVTSFEPLQIVVSAIGLNALSTAYDRWSRDTLLPQRHSFFHPSLDAVTLYVSNAVDDCDATIVPEAWIASSSSDYCVPRAGGAIELACRATDRSKRLSLVHTTNDASSSSPAPENGSRLYARWVSGGETSHSLTHDEEDGISVEGSVESPLGFDRGLTNSPWVLPGESSQDTSNRASPTVGIVEVTPNLVFKTSASAVLPPRRIGSDADYGRLAFDGFGAISEDVGIVEEEEEEEEDSLGDHFPDGGGDDDEPLASQRRRPSEILDERHLFKIKVRKFLF